MVSCGQQISVLISIFALGMLLAYLSAGAGRGHTEVSIIPNIDTFPEESEEVKSEDPEAQPRPTVDRNTRLNNMGHAGEDGVPVKKPMHQEREVASFNPKSPIYVSQNINVSYHAGRVVVPFQFRKGFSALMAGARKEVGQSGGEARFVVDPHTHIVEGRRLATNFIELWRKLGKGADFPQIPYSEYGAPFWIENVRKKLRIHLPEVKVRPLLGQVLKRDEVTQRLISQAEANGKDLPDQQLLLKPGHKRLMLDVGARQFQGSPLWLGKHYTEAKTFDFVAFELLDLQDGYKDAGSYFKSVRYIQKAGWTHDKGVKISGVRMAKVVDGEEAPTTVDSTDGGEQAQQPTKKGPTFWNAPSVDLAAFIRQEATPEDFVVMKLDIEGGEWPLLQHLVNEGIIPYYIDEIMMECHAKDPNTYSLLGFKLLPPECMDLITDLREMGVYAHRWV